MKVKRICNLCKVNCFIFTKECKSQVSLKKKSKSQLLDLV